MGLTSSWKVGDVAITRVVEFETGWRPAPGAGCLDAGEA
jgi:hypothetical protein